MIKLFRCLWRRSPCRRHEAHSGLRLAGILPAKLSLCAALLLSACVGGNKPASELRLYTLNPPPVSAAVDAPKKEARGGKILAVALPETRPGLDSRRIALRQGKTGFNYIAGARWEGPLPDMLQPLLVQSLEHTGRFRAVIPAGGNAETALLLVPEIRALEAVYADENVNAAPTASVSITARLYAMPARRLIANLPVSTEVTARSPKLEDIVSALDEAWQQAAAELAKEVTNIAR